MKKLNSFGSHAEHPEDGLFFVAAVATGVDADGSEFATFTPTFDGKSGNTQDLGDFTNGE